MVVPSGCGPPDSEEYPCLLCGEYADTCNCEVCQVDVEGEACGVQGCLQHFPDRKLVNLLFELEARLYGLQKERGRREAATPLTCSSCGHTQPSNLMAAVDDGYPICEKCGVLIGGSLPESIFEEVCPC